VALLAVLALPSAAGAQHNQLEWISTNSNTSGSCPNSFPGCDVATSADGRRVAFMSDGVYLNDHGTITFVGPGYLAGATPDVTHIYFDNSNGLYQWSGGVTTLVSAAAVCFHDEGPCLSKPGAVSDDGSHVFFETSAQLAPEDTDTTGDIYVRSGGTTRLVSTAAGSASNDFFAASSDGSKAFYRVTNFSWKLYEYSNGVSTEVPLGNERFTFGAISRDGSRVFFTTKASLVPSDQDENTCLTKTPSGTIQSACEDVYEYSNGTMKLISAKPDGAGGSGAHASFAGLSPDEQHVFFLTGEQLVPEDADGLCSHTFYDENRFPAQYPEGCSDVYDRSGGTTTLVSTGPTGGTLNYDARYSDSSTDGSHVLFETREPVVAGDDSNSDDVFERAGGTTALVSVGPLGHGGLGGVISDDGSRALFLTTTQRLLPEDTEAWADVYERFGGRTYLVTDFGTQSSLYEPNLLTAKPVATPDLAHVFIHIPDQAVAGDTDTCPPRSTTPDSCWDLYEASIGPPVGFPRPKGASPMYVSLVPAYQPCTSPNRTHGAPLAFGSCAPPLRQFGYLTVGTPDANGAGARSVGGITIATKTGNPATAADDADVRLAMSFTDVRLAAGLDDYTGELQARLPIRLTDSGRSAPITNPPQTVQDVGLRFTATCATTVSTSEGATCSTLTTADAVVPGIVREDNRAVWQLDQIYVFDGGPDGDVDTQDNGIFARQGIFTP
jgi:hypothetical protein